MPNKPVTAFNKVTTLAPTNLLHVIVGNVDKRIEWQDVLALINVGGIDGTLTPGFHPVALDPNTLADGRVFQNGSYTRMFSPNGATYVNITDTSAQLYQATSGGSSQVNVTPSSATLSFSDSTSGSIIIDNSGMVISESASINLASNTVRLNNLTANRVVYLGSGKEFVASAVTPTQLSYLDATSSIQTQINAKLGTALTTGHILTGVSGVATPLAPGTNGQVLTIVSGVPVWSAVTGSGTVTSVATGSGLTGGPITGTGTISIANLGVTNAMIANGTIDLSTKVTSVLPYANGGIGVPTVPTTNALPYAGATGYLYDAANYNFDPSTKTLNVNNLNITPSSGITGITMECPTSTGITFVGSLPFLDAVYDGDGYAINISADANTGGDAKGIFVSTIDIAGDFFGEKEVLRITQTGEAAANNNLPAAGIYRDINLVNANGTFTATGSMLDIIDSTPSTGNGIRVRRNDVDRFVNESTGKTWYQLQADVKVSLSGSIGYSTTQVSSVGSTPTDIFTKTIKGGTLSNDGDELRVKYTVAYAEEAKSKAVAFIFGGVTLGTISITPSSGGAGVFHLSIIRTSSTAIIYSIEFNAYDGAGSHYSQGTVFTAAATNGSDQILKLTATCQAGSLNGGVVGKFAKYLLNPEF